VKIVMSLNDFLQKESDSLKTKLQNNSMQDYEEKLIDLINFSTKLLKIYDSYQMKDITYNEFKNQIIGQDNSKQINNLPVIPEKVKNLIDSVVSSMDAYKKNKMKYLDLIIANDE